MQIGVRCPRGEIEWEECLTKCAPNPLHPCDYTPDLLNLMRVDYADPDREPGVESFTPTRLLGCQRRGVLEGDADYFVDVDGAYKMVRGHMVHRLMELANYPSAVSVMREKRMGVQVETSFGPKLFTGKADLIVLKQVTHNIRDGKPEFIYHCKVVDYKSTSEIKHELVEAKPEHVLQVNMYAWLVQQALSNEDELYLVDELEIVYCDMRKTRRFTSAGWRKAKGKRISTRPLRYEDLDLAPITLHQHNRIGAFIQRGIERKLSAREELPPPLEGDDAWVCAFCPVFQVCQDLAARGQ